MRNRPIVRRAPFHPLGGILVSLVALAVAIPADAALPRDTSGWTVFRPTKDSRIVFVSTSRGDDAMARGYSASEVPDPATASDTVKAYRTYEAAYATTREKMPDWILLRRGDTLKGALRWRSGQSQDASFLIGAYGLAGPSPLVMTDTSPALSICCKSFNDLVVTGIDFMAEGRAYGHPRYVASSKANGITVYVGPGYQGRGLHVEGCRFSWYSNNTLQSAEHAGLTDVVVRRSGFFDNYSTISHAQGLYAANLVGMVLEDNVFDHNGWFKQGKNNSQDSGMATIFNHNTYFANCHSVVFRGNLFLRGSSIGTKWTANNGPGSSSDLVLDDNLYVDNEVGISLGGNVYGPHRFKNVHITNNVLMHPGRSRQTGRTLGWGIDIDEWDSGSVDRNLLVHGRSEEVTNVRGLYLNGSSRNLTVSRNVVWGWQGNLLVVDTATTRSKVVVGGNRFDAPTEVTAIAWMKPDAKSVTFRDNQWLHPKAPTFRVGNSAADLQAWIAATGETGATDTAAALPDTTRGIETYQQSKGRPATMASFLEDVRKQSRTSWRTAYSASEVNRWIRAGFIRDVSTSRIARPSEVISPSTKIRSVFGGRLRETRGQVEVRTLQGALVYQGPAEQASRLPDGPVVVRVFPTTSGRDF